MLVNWCYVAHHHLCGRHGSLRQGPCVQPPGTWDGDGGRWPVTLEQACAHELQAGAWPNCAACFGLAVCLCVWWRWKGQPVRRSLNFHGHRIFVMLEASAGPTQRFCSRRSICRRLIRDNHRTIDYDPEHHPCSRCDSRTKFTPNEAEGINQGQTSYTRRVHEV